MENSAREKYTKPADLSKDPRWGFSPVSRRYILRTGAVWKRLVKAGVVVDEEVAEQLARPAQGTQRRPKVNNVTIEADREAVRDAISDNFDASRLTGAQLASIADQIARMGLGSGAGAQRPRRPKKARRPASDEDSLTDEDDLTETTAASESDAAAPDPREVARAVAERLRAVPTPTPAIKVVRPTRRPR